MVSPSMTESTPKKPPIRRARKPNISSARKKQDNGRNVEVAMRTFEENIRGKNNNTGEKNPIIGEIMYTFKDKNVPPSDGATGIESALDVVREFVNVCTVSVTARLVTSDENSTDTPAKNQTITKPKKKPTPKPRNVARKCESDRSGPPIEPLTKLAESKLDPLGTELKPVESQLAQLNPIEPQRTYKKPDEPQLNLLEPAQTQLNQLKPVEPKSQLEPTELKSQPKSAELNLQPKYSELTGTELPPCTLQSTQIVPTETQHTLLKPVEPKTCKKVIPLKVHRVLKKVETNPNACDTRLSQISCISEPVCNDVDVSELENLSGGEEPASLKSLELTEPLEIDLLSLRPRKKHISPYSQYKKAYGLKYNVQGNSQGDSINKKEMTMHDLIFYNPTSNPMSNSQEQVKKGPSAKVETNDFALTKLEEEMIDDVDEDDSELPVPQLKLSADGQIILDPKSLVVQTSAEKSLKALENSSIIEEDGQTINRFSKAKKKYHYWTPLETLRFYRALNTIGTDFSLMQTLFPNRTRYDLKKKFKKEERTNRELIDKALAAAAEFDVDMLEEDIKKDAERAEMQRKAKEELARKKKEEKEALKKDRKLNKSKPIKNMVATDTGTFENRKSTAWEKPTNKVKTARRWKKKIIESDSSDDEEEEPQFDSLYPSDDDDEMHGDHTYSKISMSLRKKIKYSDDESDDEFEYKIKPSFEKIKIEKGTSHPSHVVLCESEDIGINSISDNYNEISENSIALRGNGNSGTYNNSDNHLILCEDDYSCIGISTINEIDSGDAVPNGVEFIGLKNECQIISKSNSHFITPCENEHLYLKNPHESGIEISKTVVLYGNQLVGVNNESESETETRNEEKENENQNLNDAIMINEYIIVSENVDVNESKSLYS